MKRQTEIHENLMFMQKNEMKKLRDWMTDMEDRISQMGEILFSTIEDHVKDQSTLELDITEHQVSFFFVIFSEFLGFFLDIILSKIIDYEGPEQGQGSTTTIAV